MKSLPSTSASGRGSCRRPAGSCRTGHGARCRSRGCARAQNRGRPAQRGPSLGRELPSGRPSRRAAQRFPCGVGDRQALGTKPGAASAGERAIFAELPPADPQRSSSSSNTPSAGGGGGGPVVRPFVFRQRLWSRTNRRGAGARYPARESGVARASDRRQPSGFGKRRLPGRRGRGGPQRRAVGEGVHYHSESRLPRHRPIGEDGSAMAKEPDSRRAAPQFGRLGGGA